MPWNGQRASSPILCRASLFAALLWIGSWPSITRAEPRFGDSTWVAPSIPSDALAVNPETTGPRVAKRDSERAWETMMRAPFRVAFFPLRLLARGIEGLGPLAEKVFPPGDLFRVTRPKKGVHFSPEFLGASVTANQFAGPGTRAKLTGTYEPLNDTRKFKLKTYVGEGVSTVGMGLNAFYDRRPNRAFYGIGNASSDRKTFFLRRGSDATLYAFLGRNYLRRLRINTGLSDMNAGLGYNGSPRAADVFTPAEVPYLSDPSRLWYYGTSAEVGALDDSLAPTLGLHFRPEVRRYKDADGSNIAYDQWRVEARGYVPVFAKRRVLAAKVVYEGVDSRSGSGPVPFYRLPESADANLFPGYGTGRFRDRRLALGQVEYRWEIEEPVSMFLLGSLGEVAPAAGALSLRAAHPALGGGLRAKLGSSQAGRLEIARGHEGITIQADLSAAF